MRILFVINDLGRGGKERQLIELLTGIKNYNDIQCELVLRKSNIEFPEIKNFNIPVHVFGTSTLPAYIKKLNLFLRARHFNIIHTWDNISTTGVIFARKTKKTVVINGGIRYAHKIQRFSKLRILEGFNMQFSKYVVANSIAGFRSFGKVPSKKYRVIYNGINIERFENVSDDSIDFPANHIVIGKIANFLEAKDYNSLVKAGLVLMDKYSNISFLFVGDGKFKREIEDIIPDKKKEKFKFLGRKKNIESYLLQMDICCLLSKPGHAEGTSNSIMEYMLASKPVIATNVGGNPELVRHDLSGFLVNHSDIQDVINRISYLIENNNKRLEMGNMGREIILKNYSNQTMTRNYINLYKEALNEK